MISLHIVSDGRTCTSACGPDADEDVFMDILRPGAWKHNSFTECQTYPSYTFIMLWVGKNRSSEKFVNWEWYIRNSAGHPSTQSRSSGSVIANNRPSALVWRWWNFPCTLLQTRATNILFQPVAKPLYKCCAVLPRLSRSFDITSNHRWGLTTQCIGAMYSYAKNHEVDRGFVLTGMCTYLVREACFLWCSCKHPISQVINLEAVRLTQYYTLYCEADWYTVCVRHWLVRNLSIDGVVYEIVSRFFAQQTLSSLATTRSVDFRSRYYDTWHTALGVVVINLQITSHSPHLLSVFSW